MKSEAVLSLATCYLLCWCTQSGSGREPSVKAPLQTQYPEIFECRGSKSQNSRSMKIRSKFSYKNSKLQFRLTKDYQPKCPGGRLAKIGLPSFNRAVLETGEVVDASPLFLPSGQLMVFGGTNFGIVYEPSEYCLLRGSKGVHEIRVCLVDCGNKNEAGGGNNGVICIPKCCPPGQVVDFISRESSGVECQPSGDLKWKPTFHKASTLDRICLSPAVGNSTPVYRLMYPKKLCQGMLLFLPRLQTSIDGYVHWTRHRWRLLDDGTVVEHHPRNPVTLGGRWHKTSEYICLDGLQNFGYGEFYRGDAFQNDQVLLDCIPTLPNTDQDEVVNQSAADEMESVSTDFPQISRLDPRTLITSILLIVVLFGSIPFFGLTLYACWLDRDSQAIHGWTVACHVLSHLLLNLFFGLALVASIHTRFNDDYVRLPGLCKFVGTMTHFFFLSTICWLTIINLDLWITFRKVRPLPSKGKQMRRFFVYCVVAIGLPLLIVSIGLGLEMNFGPGSEHDDDCDIITPEYGTERCYLAKASEGVYLYFILGALLGINFIFFAFLLRNMYAHKRSTEGVLRSKGASNTASSELFIKLFIVMGISFALEFLFWCIESDGMEQEVSILWILADMLNFFVRPILVFYILGWKKLKNAWITQDQAETNTNQDSTSHDIKMTAR